MTKEILFLLGVTVFSFTKINFAMASIRSFDVTSYGRVKMELPDNWDGIKDIYGIPLSLVGPLENGRRPVITVSPTGYYGVKLNPEMMQKDQGGFKSWREEWLKGAEGKSVEYFPYKFEKFSVDVSAHSIGYRYKVDDHIFEERSHFIECRDRIYHLKSLLNNQNEKKFNAVVATAVRSFKCE